MPKRWSSRERLLCAIGRQEPDHVPLWNLWSSPAVPFAHRNQVERAEQVLALGLDDTLRLVPPCAQQNTVLSSANVARGVEVRRFRQMGPSQPYPLLISYIIISGIPPLLDDILDLGIDVLWGVDPLQGDADLRVVKERLGKRICIWGGINSAVTLG